MVPAAAPAAAPASLSDFVDSDVGDVDLKEGGGKGKLVVGLLAAAGIAAGAFFFVNGQQEAPAPAAPVDTTPQVFKAKSVIEDTQGPKGAKGQNVDRTPGTEVQKSKRRRGGGGGGGGGNAGNNQGPEPVTSQRGDKVKLSDSDNPLGN